MEIDTPDLINNQITYNNNNIGWLSSNDKSYIKLTDINKKYYFKPNEDIIAKIFMIGGGGSGGLYYGGGGGAGLSYYNDNFLFKKNYTYEMEIGNGGLILSNYQLTNKNIEIGLHLKYYNFYFGRTNDIPNTNFNLNNDNGLINTKNNISNFSSINSATKSITISTQYTCEWCGYICIPFEKDGEYTFSHYKNTYIWIDTDETTNKTGNPIYDNRLQVTSVNLLSGIYYPIRILYGNDGLSTSQFNIGISGIATNKIITNNFSELFYTSIPITKFTSRKGGDTFIKEYNNFSSNDDDNNNDGISDGLVLNIYNNIYYNLKNYDSNIDVNFNINIKSDNNINNITYFHNLSASTKSNHNDNDNLIYTCEWIGYIYIPKNYSGNYKFLIKSHDMTYIWINNNNFRKDNAIINADRNDISKTIDIYLQEEVYIPIRIIHGNGGGSNSIYISISGPLTNNQYITDFTGLFFTLNNNYDISPNNSPLNQYICYGGGNGVSGKYDDISSDNINKPEYLNGGCGGGAGLLLNKTASRRNNIYGKSTLNLINNNYNSYTSIRRYPTKPYISPTDPITTNFLGQLVIKETITINNCSDLTNCYDAGVYSIYSSSSYNDILTNFKRNLFNYYEPNTNTRNYGNWGNNNYSSGIYNKKNYIISNYLGDWIIIKLPNPIILNSYSFLINSSLSNNAPGEWKVYGSIDGFTFTEINEASILNPISNNYYDNKYNFTKKLSDSFNIKYSFIGFTFNKLAGNGKYLSLAQIIILAKEYIDTANLSATLDTNIEKQYPSNTYISSSYEETTLPNEFLDGNTYFKQIITIDTKIDYIIYYSTSSKGTNGYTSLLFNYNQIYPKDQEGAFLGNNNYNKITGIANGNNFINSNYYGDWIFIKLPVAIILKSYLLQYTSKNINNAPKKWKVYGSNNGIDFVEIDTKDLTIASINSGADNFGRIYYKINITNIIPYLFIGFVFNQIGNNNAGYVNLYNIKLNGSEFTSATGVNLANFKGNDGVKITTNTQNIYYGCGGGGISENQILGGDGGIYPPLINPTSKSGSGTNREVYFGTDLYYIVTSFSYGAHGGDAYYLIDNDPNSNWVSLYNCYWNYYDSSNYLGDINYKGEWLYIKLPRNIVLHKYTISSGGHRPGIWKMYGSNNGINWIEIIQASQTSMVSSTSYISNTYTKILTSNSESYQYFGIVIQAIIDTGGDYAAYVSDFRLYSYDSSISRGIGSTSLIEYENPDQLYGSGGSGGIWSGNTQLSNNTIMKNSGSGGNGGGIEIQNNLNVDTTNIQGSDGIIIISIDRHIDYKYENKSLDILNKLYLSFVLDSHLYNFINDNIDIVESSINLSFINLLSKLQLPSSLISSLISLINDIYSELYIIYLNKLNELNSIDLFYSFCNKIDKIEISTDAESSSFNNIIKLKLSNYNNYFSSSGTLILDETLKLPLIINKKDIIIQSNNLQATDSFKSQKRFIINNIYNIFNFTSLNIIKELYYFKNFYYVINLNIQLINCIKPTYNSNNLIALNSKILDDINSITINDINKFNTNKKSFIDETNTINSKNKIIAHKKAEINSKIYNFNYQNEFVKKNKNYIFYFQIFLVLIFLLIIIIPLIPILKINKIHSLIIIIIILFLIIIFINIFSKKYEHFDSVDISQQNLVNIYIHNIILYLNKISINLSLYDKNDVVINSYNSQTINNTNKMNVITNENNNINEQNIIIFNDYIHNINFNKLLLFILLIISIGLIIYIIYPNYINVILLISLIIIIILIIYYNSIILNSVRTQIDKKYWKI